VPPVDGGGRDWRVLGGGEWGGGDEGRLMTGDDKAYLEGLAHFGVVFVQISPGTKRTTRTWDYFEGLHANRNESRLDLAHKWLRQGFGVGYLLRGGLAAVDADDRSTVQRIADFQESDGYLCFPKVATPSGGIHAHFRHPPDFDLGKMKNHICHPVEDGLKVAWDFKLGSRTMLVAPGTRTPKGAYRAGIWLPPPVLDVRFLAPELEIFRAEEKPFLRDQRPLQARILRAMTYLKHKAPLSRKGHGRRNALRAVAEHLVGDLDLDPSLAFYLLTKGKRSKNKDSSENINLHISWNDRCLDAEGHPAPWSDDALWQALGDAVDAVPLHGALLHQATEEKEIARWSAAAFIEMLTYLPATGGDLRITKDALYGTFLEFSGVKKESFEKCELGVEINRAIAQGRLPFLRDVRSNSERSYLGMDQRTLRIAIDTYEQQQRVCMHSA
jgi:hypothetical protein